MKKYSEFINYPISLYTSRQVTEEVPVETEESEGVAKTIKYNEDGTEVTADDVEIKTEDESEPTEPKDDTPKTKTITKQEWDW